MKIKDSFLDRAYRLRLLRRFSIRAVSMPTSPAEHSWYVAILALYIGEATNASIEGYYDMKVLLEKALLHDVPEVVTSDIVHFIKHYDHEMEVKMAQIERDVVNGPLTAGMDSYLRFVIGGAIDNCKSDDKEGHLINLCDLLDVMAYLANERSVGNRQDWVDEAFDGCHKLVLKYAAEEIEEVKETVLEVVKIYTDLFGKINLPKTSDLVGGDYARKAQKNNFQKGRSNSSKARHERIRKDPKSGNGKSVKRLRIKKKG